jgi:hypothetical protein
LQPLRPALYAALELGVSGRAFDDDTIVLAVRWYVRYRLSYAEVSEWLAERGILVDQSTIYRSVQRFLPLFGEVARKYRDPVGPDWRVDETYARIRGCWHYIYRAIDGTDRSSMPMSRQHAIWLLRAGSLSRLWPPARRRHGGSSLTKPGPTHPRWPRRYRVCCIELGATAPMAWNVTTGF